MKNSAEGINVMNLSRVSLSTGGVTFQQQVNLCKKGESFGIGGFWFSEVNGWDSFTPIAAISKETKRIRLGSAVAGIFGRSPLVTAMSSAALADITKGRFTLGLGSQAKNYVTGWHGVEFKQPALRMREYVKLVRMILSGEKVNFSGTLFRIEDFQLHPKPEYSVKIAVAAIGPRMIEVAGEVGDAVLGNFWSKEYIQKTVLPSLKKGAVKSGRNVKEIRLVCGYSCFPGNPRINYKSATKPQVVMFATVPYYSKIFEDTGFQVEHRLINEAVSRGDIETALRTVTDEMVESFTIVGERDAFQRRIKQLLNAGLDEVMLHPIVSNSFHPLFPRHLPLDINKFDGKRIYEIYETCKKTLEILT